MATIEENVNSMKAAGVPQPEIENYLARFQKPAMAFESPEGARQRSFESPRREISTVTNAPVPTTEESWNKNMGALASGVRYGVPIAAGIVAPELTVPVMIAQAVLAGGSEVLARRIERTASDPEFDTIWEDVKAGGVTGAVDLGISAALRGTGAAFRAIGRKLFIPSEIPHEIQMAQDTLGMLPALREKSPTTRFLNWMQSKPSTRPFSLTYGQINAEEKNFITTLEGIANAGMWSKGRMSKFNKRNISAIEGEIEKYVTERTAKVSGPEFGIIAQRIIGDVSERGEMFLPVVAYRKYLYTQFEAALKDSKAIVDGNALRNYIREFGDIEGGLPRSIYSELRSSGLVPPLDPTTTTKRSVTNVRTQKVAEEQVSEARNLERTNLKDGKVTQIEDTLTGTRARANEGSSQTIRETETIGGMTEQELVDAWSNISLNDTNAIIKVINSHWKDLKDTNNNVLSYMGRKIEADFMRNINQTPLLADLHGAADEFFKKEVTFMRNSAIRGLRKTLTDNPSKALSLLGSGESPARETYDRLTFLKGALNFSAESPRVGASLQKALSQDLLSGAPAIGDKQAIAEALTEGAKAGKYSSAQAAQEFEQTFLRPLRYRLITRHMDQFGNIEPNRFLDMLNANKDVPEFYTEVFGGAAQLDRIKELMTTLSVNKRQPAEKSIFIQLAQAGQIAGGIGALGAAISSDDPTIKAGGIAGGAAIMLSPYMLARAFTNAETIRALTDGIKEGVRSSRLALALRKMSEMKVMSEMYRDTPTDDATNYYTTIPVQEQQ